MCAVACAFTKVELRCQKLYEMTFFHSIFFLTVFESCCGCSTNVKESFYPFDC